MTNLGGPSAASKTLPRVVYFIASHVNPEQVARLVRACRSGSQNSRVLLHHDDNVSVLDRALLAEVDNLDILPSEGDVGWGAFSMCAMVIRCMTWLRDNRDFDWVVYVSGQDYPVKSPTQIEHELAGCDVDGFLQADPVQSAKWAEGAERYLYQYYNVPRVRGWSKAAHLLRRLGQPTLQGGGHPRLWARPEDPSRLGVRQWPFADLDCYRGSSWWSLSRKSIEYMLDYAEAHPRLAAHYQRVGFAPNESFFLTILRNNPGLRLANDHKRFMKWSQPGTGHPDFLTAADVPAMLNSTAFFARKLDQTRDPQVLDLLDAALGLNTMPQSLAKGVAHDRWR